MTRKLMPDERAPELKLRLLGGSMWSLADEGPRALTMIVVYRGYHCPICRTYLSQLNEMVEDFEKAGASVIAVSMDTQERAEKAKSEWGLDRLRVGYGMSETDARKWGLWLSSSIRETEPSVFPEPGLFWIRPDGRLYLIDIASMPFARPSLELLVERVPRINEGYPARGTA